MLLCYKIVTAVTKTTRECLLMLAYFGGSPISNQNNEKKITS